MMVMMVMVVMMWMMLMGRCMRVHIERSKLQLTGRRCPNMMMMMPKSSTTTTTTPYATYTTHRSTSAREHTTIGTILTNGQHTRVLLPIHPLAGLRSDGAMQWPQIEWLLSADRLWQEHHIVDQAGLRAATTIVHRVPVSTCASCAATTASARACTISAGTGTTATTECPIGRW
uniref:Putative secreted protein n=1 Tax=Anopheles darlingi TaxID=43151 RepID=A0A2M4D2T0_ANODA